MSDPADPPVCDCSHARDLHEEGVFACIVSNCDCVAFLPLEGARQSDLADEDEEEVMEPYEQDPDFWKA